MALLQINKNPRARDLRLFVGLWFPLFFAFIGFQVWRKTGSLMTAGIVWGVAAFVALFGLAFLPLARLLYVGITAITYPIGWVLSHVILGTVFFGVFTPIALLMRGVGRDPMNRKLDRAAKTYWIARDERVPVDRYFRQY
jgi:hypothetical protein